MLDTLALRIWENPQFKADIDYLDRTKVKKAFAAANIVVEDVRPVDALVLQRLAQVALIFASCNEIRYLESAQRISTGIKILGGEELDGYESIFSVIQGRLKNFPAVGDLRNQTARHKNTPPQLMLEFLEARERHTVRLGANHEYVFTPFQKNSWKVLETGASAALSGPTSAGKSFVISLHLVSLIERYRDQNIAYIVPTRALVNQVAEDMATALSKHGVLDVTITTIPVSLETEAGRGCLYVLTQERLQSLILNFPSVALAVVVVDEAQILGSGARGILLESVIDQVKASNPSVQLVFSGPLIENPEYFGDIFHMEGFGLCSTEQASVTQNLIYLDYVDSPNPSLRVRAAGMNGVLVEVDRFALSLRLYNEGDKLSYLSSLFGNLGGNIVFAAGKSDAEKIALKIAQERPRQDQLTDTIKELIKLVKKHVHKDYALIATLEKRVGFHYGHMPSLLRRELESCFKNRELDYLVCTSTLLYGLNLPAKNIFLCKPTTGRNSPISAPDFWNLAGRVGRLGKELEGNVFLIDYAGWETNPVAGRKGMQVRSALSVQLENANDFIEFIKDESISSEKNLEREIALGKLVVDSRTGSLAKTISKYRSQINSDGIESIFAEVEGVSSGIDLPVDILQKNIGVSIYRQRDLFNYFVQRLGTLSPAEIVPAHPQIDFRTALENYRRAFRRIHTYLLNYPGSNKSHNFFSGLALRWMRGDALPKLIASAIQQYPDKNKASLIRGTMENIEDDLRFRYVKFFTCYNSLLKHALIHTGHESYIQTIPDIPLYLEMGGSSGAMINLMALGLSRTTAEELSDYITNKDISIAEVRQWLSKQNFDQLDIPVACIREVQSLLGEYRY